MTIVNWREAVRNARMVLEQLPCGIMTETKKRVLLRYAEILKEKKDTLVALAIANGYNFLQAGELGAEVMKAASRLTYYANSVMESVVVCEQSGLNLIRRPAGTFAGYTAPNYPVIESAAVSGFINSLLSGCPMVVRKGALTGAMDVALVELAAQALRECAGPKDFITVCEVPREETDQFLDEVDFLYFIGGQIGHELVRKTRKQYGVVQTGLPNAAVVYPGAEGVAATKLGEQFGSRLALSCSNTTGVLLHADCDMASFLSSLAECALSSCHARDKSGVHPAARFEDGLKISLQSYLSGGATWYPAQGQSNYDALRFGVDPILLSGPAVLFTDGAQELFGRALLACQNDIEWQAALQRLPATKTIQVFHPENSCPVLDESILIGRTSRLILDHNGKVNQPDPGPCSIHGSPLFGYPQVIDPMEFVIRCTIVRP